VTKGAPVFSLSPPPDHGRRWDVMVSLFFVVFFQSFVIDEVCSVSSLPFHSPYELLSEE